MLKDRKSKGLEVQVSLYTATRSSGFRLALLIFILEILLLWKQTRAWGKKIMTANGCARRCLFTLNSNRLCICSRSDAINSTWYSSSSSSSSITSIFCGWNRTIILLNAKTSHKSDGDNYALHSSCYYMLWTVYIFSNIMGSGKKQTKMRGK